MSYSFITSKIMPVWPRNSEKLLKTVPIIFLRNDGKMGNLLPCIHLAVSFMAWLL